MVPHLCVLDNVDGKPIEFVCKDGKAVVYAIQEKALALKARSRFVPPPPPDEAPPSLQEEVPRDDDMDDDLPPPPSYPPPPDPPAADASEAKAEPKTMTNAGKGLSAGARETMHEAKLKGKRVQLAASDMGLQVFDDKTGAVLETHMYQLLDGWSVSSKGLTVTPKGSAKSIVFVCESGKAVVLEMQEKALALKAATKKRLGEVKRPEGAAEEEEAEEGGSGGRAMVTSSDTGFTFTVGEGELHAVEGLERITRLVSCYEHGKDLVLDESDLLIEDEPAELHMQLSRWLEMIGLTDRITNSRKTPRALFTLSSCIDCTTLLHNFTPVAQLY